jgi:hypothetical protein
MGVCGQHHALAALYPWQNNPRTHWIGSWVGLRAGLDTLLVLYSLALNVRTTEDEL